MVGSSLLNAPRPAAQTPRSIEEAKDIMSRLSVPRSDAPERRLPGKGGRPGLGALVGELVLLMLRELNVAGTHDHVRTLATDQDEGIYDFLTVPVELEKFVCVGMILCLDAFLHFLVVLPVRLLVALCRCALALVLKRRALVNNMVVVDLVNSLLACCCLCALLALDTSTLYHFIRNQALIKLYVIWNMLDVVDRLCTSMGQDMLRQIHCTFTLPSRPSAGAIVRDLTIAFVYVAAHAMLKYVQVTTLHVAINTSDTGIIIILITTNFVEIKSTVFKKSTPELLHKLACSDAVEMSQHLLFLMLIIWEKVAMSNWAAVRMVEQVQTIAFWMACVVACEVVVDAVKHAFITKYNHIRPSVYKEFRKGLYEQVVQMKHSRTRSFYSIADIATIVIGFPGIPLACLTLRMLQPLAQVELTPTYLKMAAMVWACLLLFKVTLTTFLTGFISKRCPNPSL